VLVVAVPSLVGQVESIVENYSLLDLAVFPVEEILL